MAYNTTASLDKLTCTDYVDFAKCQESFGRFSWTKIESKYLDIKLKVFRREDKNAEFRLRRYLSMGEADFKQFIPQRYQVIVAADNFLWEQSLSPVLQSTVQRHGGTTEACSQSDWRCGSPKQKTLRDIDAIQGGQAKNLLCSSSVIRTEEGGKFSAICVCQL